jgi:hypothetical protein
MRADTEQQSGLQWLSALSVDTLGSEAARDDSNQQYSPKPRRVIASDHVCLIPAAVLISTLRISDRGVRILAVFRSQGDK